MAKTKQSMEKPIWLKMSEEELKKIIVELAGKYQPAQIGLVLRDQYGVPTTKIFGKKLAVYLKEAGIDTKAELKNVEAKVERMKEHLKANVTDKIAKHKLQKAQSRAIKVRKYFEKR